MVCNKWRVMPNLCGLALQEGVMWVAEICGIIGFGVFMDSIIKLGMSRTEYDYCYGLCFTYIVPLILGFMQFIFSIALAIGAHKKISCLVYPWIVFFSFQTVILAITFIVGAIIAAVSPIGLIMPFSLSIFISGVLYCELMRYCILGVNSLYEDLKKQTDVVQPSTLQFTTGFSCVQAQIPAPNIPAMPVSQLNLQQINSQIPPIPSNMPNYQWVLQPSTLQTAPTCAFPNAPQECDEQGMKGMGDISKPLLNIRGE